MAKTKLQEYMQILAIAYFIAVCSDFHLICAFENSSYSPTTWISQSAELTCILIFQVANSNDRSGQLRSKLSNGVDQVTDDLVSATVVGCPLTITNTTALQYMKKPSELRQSVSFIVRGLRSVSLRNVAVIRIFQFC